MIVPESGASPLRPVGQMQAILSANEARFSSLPSYIFGLHDPGGEAHLLAAEKPGWIVVSATVNAPDQLSDFTSLVDKGNSVIVRLNNGNFHAGTIPNSTDYERFALRCVQFVGKSKGAHIWVIGNEPNSAAERPGYDGSEDSGQVISPDMYARCFNACRKAIRALPAHGNDWVIPAAIAPFNTQTSYISNPSGDWVRYFADVLFQITAQQGALDGIALHTSTHGADAALISSEAKAGGHFAGRHWHFRAYRDFLTAVPPTLRNLPVFITEAHPMEPGWTVQNRNWIQSACSEINLWNLDPGNQPIQALCFFRWLTRPGEPVGWGIADKLEVVQDFSAALQNEYRVRWPATPPKPDRRAQWTVNLKVSEKGIKVGDIISGKVTVKNGGAKSWPSTGKQAVRLGYRWFDLNGNEVLLHPAPGRFSLLQKILPGQTAIFDRVELRAPRRPGDYVLRYDLVQGEDRWFGHTESPVVEFPITVNPPAYAIEWTSVPLVKGGIVETGAQITGSARAKNVGSTTWHKDGSTPVKIGYRWYDSQGVETHAREASRTFTMESDAAPGGIAEFKDIEILAPQRVGTYTLVWDLYHEGVTSFSAKGASTHSQKVQVNHPLPDYAVKWSSVLNIPNALGPNETVEGTISIQNTGARDWDSKGDKGVRLISWWYDKNGNRIPASPDSGELPLPEDVPPGGSAIWQQVNVRAPIPRGEYRLVFDLKKDGLLFSSIAGSRAFDLPIEIKTDSPDYLVEWCETPHIPDNTMIAGEHVLVHALVKNAGALPWSSSGENEVSLGYKWFNAQGQISVCCQDRFPLIQDAAPREFAEFEQIAVETPVDPGDYILKFDLRHDILGWFEDLGSLPALLTTTVKPVPLDWGAEFLSHDIPTSLAVGQETTVEIQVRNIGKNTWRADGANPVSAKYRWINGSGQPQTDAPECLSRILSEIPPSRSTLISARLASPLTPGVYRLEWDLMAEGIGTFAEGGNPILEMTCRVSAGPTATNLWRAEASHNTLSAYRAIDGDLESFWSSRSKQAPGMWFRVNLGEPRLIDGIAFRSPGSSFPSGYSLKISPDGLTWLTVSHVERGNSCDIVANFASARVSDVLVELTTDCTEEWCVAEIQVHPSLAWNATASLNNEAAPNAIDNDPSTFWTSEQSQTPDMWFQLDLGGAKTVTGLRMIAPGDEYPVGCRVSVWNEHVGGWQKVAERQNNRESVEITFAPVRTQYLNVHLLQEAGKPWAIREASVTMAMTDWIGPNG